jgi:acetyl/propionyl-CoA carboxylase alpha subunit
LLEKYFTDVRHVEVQVLGDRHGQIVHLFERECSVQRRHQKIIEESPSPAVSDDLREAMTQAALSLANAVGYVSAGTLEFVLTPDGSFYFLEMNTRLQVEHPVTELVTGIDLAAWQIRLASGEPLTFTQSDLKQQGHALECRIYAEDPQHDFLPSIGQIEFYRPPAGPGVRVDDGIEAGTQVSPYYDPMLAKVITYGDDRQEAIRKMVRALEDTVIFGVTTNIPYLLDILANDAFLAGDISTKFIEQEMDPWRPAADTSNSTWLSLAAFEALGGRSRRTKAGDSLSQDMAQANHSDPWQNGDSWRNTSA